MFVLCLFVFNATATPKIFTYAHTRSLHDAFPSLSAECCTDEGACDRRTKKPPVDVSGTGKGIAGRGRAETALHLVGGKRREGRQSRSEEHTSELQSLLRISYTVFCLQKTKKKNTKQASEPTTTDKPR